MIAKLSRYLSQVGYRVSFSWTRIDLQFLPEGMFVATQARGAIPSRPFTGENFLDMQKKPEIIETNGLGNRVSELSSEPGTQYLQVLRRKTTIAEMTSGNRFPDIPGIRITDSREIGLAMRFEFVIERDAVDIAIFGLLDALKRCNEIALADHRKGDFESCTTFRSTSNGFEMMTGGMAGRANGVA